MSCASIAAMEQGQDPLHPHAGDPVFDLHVGGKMETVSTVALTGPAELSLAYTPGVALVCEAIAADPSMTQHYTWVPNVVAIVSDGMPPARIHATQRVPSRDIATALWANVAHHSLR